MSEPKHAPGKWVVGSGSWDGEEYWTVETTDGAIICMEPTEFSAYASGAFITPDGHEPNARLIAAAPDMLEVLEFINEWFRTAHVDTIHGSTLCGDGDDETTLAEAIQQALAKAKGEQQE